jgi:hypothetical protein
MKEGKCMFAVMIGNDSSDVFKIKKTISLLKDIIDIASVDQGRIAGLSHDLPDVQDLLSWYQDIYESMNLLHNSDTLV